MSSQDKFGLLGNGWSTLEDTTANEIVRFTINELEPSNECNIYRCESTEDIISHMDLGGSVGVQHALAEVEAKASFLKSCTKSSHSITLLVKTKRTWRALIQDALFKKDQDLQSTIKDATKLLKYAGDSYISEVEVGTEYYAAYQFNASSSEERTKISLALDGKFGGALKVKVQANADIESLCKSTGSSFSFVQKLVGADFQTPGIDEVAKFALELTGKDIRTPQLLNYKTTPYSILPGAPSGLEVTEKQVRAYLEAVPNWYLHSLRDMEMRARLVLDRNLAVQTMYQFYNASQESQGHLKDHVINCTRLLNTIAEWKSQLIQNLKSGKANELYPKPKVDLDVLKIPHPSFDRVFGEKWGRQEGGAQWFDFDDEIVYSFGYPRTFKGKGGLVLDQLTTVYRYRNPADPMNPDSENQHSEPRGGSGGRDWDFNHTLHPGEVATIGLWSKSYRTQGETDEDFNRYSGLICGFEIYQKDNSQSLLMGRKDGPWKKNEVPANSFFLGFQGRAASQIDCLQPVYVTFKEPIWSPFLPGV